MSGPDDPSRGRATDRPAGPPDEPDGAPAHAPSIPRRRRGVRIALLASAVVILLCLTVGLILAIPIARQYPAALSMPDQLAGQPRLDAPTMQPLVQQISDDLKQATGGNRTIAGLYGHRDDAEHVFMIAGTTALVLDPNGALADAMTTGRLWKATSAGFTVEKGQDVDPGPHGGSIRCAPGTFYNELPISVCGWADHGSLVLGIFFRMSLDDAAARLREIRQTILSR